LLAHVPAPLAVMRREHVEAVGGWNFDLPPGWRDWDLAMALADANLEGTVLPLWLARYVPHARRAAQPLPREQLSVMLDLFVERHPRLFGAWGTALWRHRMLVGDAPPPPGPPPSHWSAWWVLTKTGLLHQFPRTGALYRRLRYGIPVPRER